MYLYIICDSIIYLLSKYFIINNRRVNYILINVFQGFLL